MLLGYEARFFQGALITIALSVAALAVALLLGLWGATAKTSANPLWRRVATFYTTVVRGIPELLFITLIYFDLQRLINYLGDQIGATSTWIIPPFFAGMIGIGLFYGAYMTETFRGALLAVARGQSEAGVALGMNRWQVFFRLIFPQMLRHALPGIRNNWLVLLKATALVSIIGLSNDMMAVANQAKTKTGNPFLFYLAVAAVYLLLTMLSGLLFDRLEKRAKRGLSQC